MTTRWQDKKENINSYVFPYLDVKLLMDFLKGVENGTLVLIASYDDPATK